MKDKATVTCAICAIEIHWLEVFPGDICLECHDKKTAHLTPQQLLDQVISGFTINAINTHKKGKK